jgi:disulfide oxidoreductase YuzD
MVAQHLSRRYGDAVKVEYVDLAKESEARKHADVLESIRAQGAPTPVVAIDGELKIAGYVDFWSISELIDGKKNGEAQKAS